MPNGKSQISLGGVYVLSPSNPVSEERIDVWIESRVRTIIGWAYYTPMESNSKLLPDQGEFLEDPGQYRRLIVKLIYLTNTRPDTFSLLSELCADLCKNPGSLI